MRQYRRKSKVLHTDDDEEDADNFYVNFMTQLDKHKSLCLFLLSFFESFIFVYLVTIFS